MPGVICLIILGLSTAESRSKSKEVPIFLKPGCSVLSRLLATAHYIRNLCQMQTG